MSARSFYVLAYDLANDRRRQKIARLMEATGSRVQGSVFEAYLTASELELRVKKSGKIMVLKEDSLRVYVLCADCRAKVWALGLGKVTPPPGVMVV